MRIIFMGTPDFAVPCLDALVNNGYEVVAVVTQPDKPFGRKQSILKAPPVKEDALALGIDTILQPVKVRTPEFLESIRNLKPDLIVTAAYGRILTKAVLDVPPMGCINVHGSLLPKYRGSAPIQWALINGDKVTGVTTMFMDEGMDTGDILLMKELSIPPDMNAEELYDKLKVLGSEALLDTMKALEDGTLRRTPQDHSKAVNIPMITKELGQIDWNKSAVQVHNLVRGTYPWPGAYTFYKGGRMKIWKTALPGSGLSPDTEEISGKTGRILPGTIVKIQKDFILVAAGEGCVKVLEVQFENGRRMGVHECGHNMDEGEVLG